MILVKRIYYCEAQSLAEIMEEWKSGLYSSILFDADNQVIEYYKGEQVPVIETKSATAIKLAIALEELLTQAFPDLETLGPESPEEQEQEEDFPRHGRCC